MSYYDSSPFYSDYEEECFYEQRALSQSQHSPARPPKQPKVEWGGYSANDYSYQSSSGLRTAIEKKPKKNLQKIQKREKYMEKVEVWVCKICKKKYANKTSLNRHFETAHVQPKSKTVAQSKAVVQKPQGFVCRYCKGVYSTQGNLNRHVTTIHEKPRGNNISTKTNIFQKNETKTNVTINVYNPVNYNFEEDFF